MKKIITYVMIFTMLITTAAVSMAVPASAAVKKQSKRQVTLIRSYNKIYRKCKKNFKYDGSQLEMNQDSYKEFKIWDKELNRVYKLLYKGLSAKQKKLRNLYKTVLNISRLESAIVHGDFFDLMYVNGENPSFNPHRQYAFLRKYGNELLVIVVNFDDRQANVKINIPDHAFETMKIVPGKYEALELIGGDKEMKELSPEIPFACALSGYGAAVWKIELKNFSKEIQKK